MAWRLLDAGADINLPATGLAVGWDAAEEVQEHEKAWIIGIDTDWTLTNPEFANIILTSIEKRFDISVVQVAKAIVDGRFTGGNHVSTLETGEVGISPFHNLDSLISAKVKAGLEQIKADIIAGKIKTKP